MLPCTRLRRLRTIKGEVCFSYCRIDIACCLFGRKGSLASVVSVARSDEMDGWLERHERRRLIAHGIILSIFAVIIMWKSISAVV